MCPPFGMSRDALDGAHPCGLGVDVHRPVPVLLAKLGGSDVHPGCRIVDQHVEPAVLRFHRLEETAYLVRVSQVRPRLHAAYAERLDLLLRGIRGGVTAEVVEGDVRAPASRSAALWPSRCRATRPLPGRLCPRTHCLSPWRAYTASPAVHRDHLPGLCTSRSAERGTPPRAPRRRGRRTGPWASVPSSSPSSPRSTPRSSPSQSSRASPRWR